jgi:hypothetical protein
MATWKVLFGTRMIPLRIVMDRHPGAAPPPDLVKFVEDKWGRIDARGSEEPNLDRVLVTLAVEWPLLPSQWIKKAPVSEER